ncbi:MAG TPA: DNA translocase FtsK [Candidatus Limnocylindrales bacterium]
MATRRRPPAARPRTRAPRRRSSGPGLPRLSPDVTRSLVAVVLLVLGAVILIGLVFQGRGALTDWILNVIAPWFGSGRWLLPLVLIGLGVWLERAGGVRAGWLRTLAGSAIAYAAALALIALLADGGMLDGRSGGRIGAWLASVVGRLVSPLGASVVFVGVLLAGLVIALDRPVRELLAPFGRGARGLGSALAAPAASAGAAAIEQARRSRAEPAPPPGSGATVRDGRSARDAARPEIPSPFEQPAQVSSVFSGPPPAPITGERMTLFPDGAAMAPGRVAVAEGSPVGGGPGVAAAPVRREYRLPPMTLLDDAAPRTSTVGMDHAHNARIIESKLASFNIPSQVTRWNAGPVVTQYEVEPDPSIKVSRIEALADDLAMALAARTIRIEAPIPGRKVVGLEIPNNDFNVVAIRQILEHPEAVANRSPIAFALGRDVAGHPRVADLAKMPHLLIAGATGSGKSVMVNALITSLLMRATPDDVRLILVDPKRVELADYNGMPHLYVPVITEADRAIAALKWAVGEMEMRYRKFAGATARNIVSYNEARADPADRLPYIVIIVDELADLMMRKGQTVEDPIVRLAQKARATGIHLVLATQRPSVNVVTGLIKANFPSRIAFAMASQIDSRTILDAPGAEDLIGRGDMLFQPSDLPRPIRLQGVFVADREIRAVTAHWRAEAEPHYDLGIIEDDEESTGSVDDLADDDADRLLREAVGVVQEYDRASASLLQRRLKIGYARAARIIDQLEARGYIGPFDGSNARQVLRREASAGVAPADVDDGDER